ncbi:MAG: zinc dependent phospholipase C family protein [Lachnospiraceae bacterium]|nr:zinc dependent phospholipase C family protein [Lachnospiraceae bacterium]
MPGFYTHYLFGSTTYHRIPDDYVRHIISTEKDVYCLGLQGPDFLFYFLPSYLIHHDNLGSIMHEKRTGCFLYHLLLSCNSFFEKADRNIAMAYVFGFLGHYSLDSTAHPFIYDRTHFAHEKTQEYYSGHMGYETELDRELLDYYKHKKPSEFPQYKTIRLHPRQWRVVSSMLNEAIFHTYPEYHSTYAMIKTAITSVRFGTWLLSDPIGFKRPLVSRFEKRFFGYYPISIMIPSDKPTGFGDVLNVMHDTWKNPWVPSETSDKDFFDILEDARLDYLHLLEITGKLFTLDRGHFDRDYLKKWREEIGNRSYHSGLPCDQND